jgi:hypothetical protein
MQKKPVHLLLLMVQNLKIKGFLSKVKKLNNLLGLFVRIMKRFAMSMKRNRIHHIEGCRL